MPARTRKRAIAPEATAPTTPEMKTLAAEFHRNNVAANALKAKAEKKFREVKAEVFKPESDGGWGYEFDEVFPFKLADNTGLVENGLFFCYVPYEVGPYVLGSTEFVLPFDEIKELLK